MAQPVLLRVQDVIKECDTAGMWRPDLPLDMLLALRLAEVRIRMLEKYLEFGVEQRAEMASHMMPQLFASSHPDDIIKSANVAVEATDALIEALQK